MPDLAGTSHLRVVNWRTAFRFPELAAGWVCLKEIGARADGAALT